MKLTISQARELFELPAPIKGKQSVELRALTHGLAPKAVRQNLDLFYQEWATQGVDAWNDAKASKHIFFVGDEGPADRDLKFGWWNLPEVIGDLIIARLLNAQKGSCIMLPNASSIVLGILSCMELNQSGRRKVVCSDGEFPSVLHSLSHYNRIFCNYSAATKQEASLQIDAIKANGEIFPTKELISKIDSTTAIVFVSHVGFVRGERILDQDLQQIKQACLKHGALLAIDGYHALGSHPIDVNKIGADLYFGGLLKEGCGSSGCGFLYITPGVELTPSFSGWFGDNEPFAFNLEPKANSQVRRRFLLGTTAVASLYHGIEGSKIMLRVGLQQVADDVLAKVELATARFKSSDIYVVSPTERQRMSSMIVLQVPEANRFREYIIKEHNIFCDARRNQFIRLAPHIYNSSAEVEHAAKIICQAYTEKKYLDYMPEKAGGPVT